MAYQSLKEAILTGEMKSDAFYSEPKLAEMLHTSRTPTREALQDLAADGFVEAIPKRGYKVRSFEMDEIKYLYDFRMAIELAIISRVVAHIDEFALMELENIHRLDTLAAEKNDMASFVKINREFHRYLAGLTENPYFISSLEKILELIEWAALNVKDRTKRPPMAVEEHSDIVSAIKERDADKAYAAMKVHLLTSKKLAMQLQGAGQAD